MIIPCTDDNSDPEVRIGWMDMERHSEHDGGALCLGGSELDDGAGGGWWVLGGGDPEFGRWAAPDW